MIIKGIEYLTIEETSKLLNKHHHTIRAWIQTGILPVVKFSPRKWFINKEVALGLIK